MIATKIDLFSVKNKKGKRNKSGSFSAELIFFMLLAGFPFNEKLKIGGARWILGLSQCNIKIKFNI